MYAPQITVENSFFFFLYKSYNTTRHSVTTVHKHIIPSWVFNPPSPCHRFFKRWYRFDLPIQYSRYRLNYLNTIQFSLIIRPKNLGKLFTVDIYIGYRMTRWK